MAPIFISYRRDDAADAAARLADRLRDHWDWESVFLDIDSIRPGQDFVEALKQAIEHCEVLITVIGRQWLSITDDNGQRRLDDPDDFVRMEVVRAIQRNIHIIPVLVQNARMPREADLPDDLKLLARRNAVEVRHSTHAGDVQRLIEQLEGIFERPSGRSAKHTSFPPHRHDPVEPPLPTVEVPRKSLWERVNRDVRSTAPLRPRPAEESLPILDQYWNQDTDVTNGPTVPTATAPDPQEQHGPANYAMEDEGPPLQINDSRWRQPTPALTPERERELDQLYRTATISLELGFWQQALSTLEEIQGLQPGYRDTEQRIKQALEESNRPQPSTQQHEVWRTRQNNSSESTEDNIAYRRRKRIQPEPHKPRGPTTAQQTMKYAFGVAILIVVLGVPLTNMYAGGIMNGLLTMLVGGVIGWVASMIMGTDAQQGILLNIIVGSFGAAFGSSVGRLITGSSPDLQYFSFANLGAALIGAILVLFVVDLFFRRRLI